MTHTLAHDRCQEAISRALDSDDDLADLTSMTKVAQDFLDSLNRWNERNKHNPHFLLTDAAESVKDALIDIEVARNCQAERVQNDATEQFYERNRWAR